MLQHLPTVLGRLLRGVRAGSDGLMLQDPNLSTHELRSTTPVRLTSTSFTAGRALPVRCTDDGEGLSPALAWSGVPAGTMALVLAIEDADSPTLLPLVHAIVWNLVPEDGALAEGALCDADDGGTGNGGAFTMGRNSFLQTRYLPPDPPKGHGPHRYYLQMFALDRAPAFDRPPGRDELRAAMRGHVRAAGAIMGTYERA